MRLLATLLAALATSPLLAAPVITSISPNTAPAGGGMTVTITGSGFSTCVICSPPLPPAVMFGGTPAPSVNVVSETKLEVVTPPHTAGTVTVEVVQQDGRASLPNSFTFTGDLFAGLEPILLPVFSPPTRGAHGSEFRTIGAVVHEGFAPPVPLFGLEMPCVQVLPITGPHDPLIVEPSGIPQAIQPGCSAGPGRLLWVPSGQADRLSFNVRVRDVSRATVSHGTEIPAVRLGEFTNDALYLLNVPLETGFRNTLRIYGLEGTGVEVVVGASHYFVELQPGANEFEPAYAAFTDFEIDPAVPVTTRVTVRQVTPITSPPSRPVPIWAFISVTNNVSQEITTITPD